MKDAAKSKAKVTPSNEPGTGGHTENPDGLVPETTAIAAKREVIFGGMTDRIKLYPGWDDPIDEEDFLAGRI